MEPRVSLITLGVEDVPRATAFYERLGWRASSASTPGITFFQMKGGVGLALFSRASLADDAGVPDEAAAFRGVSLAQNLASPAEVDALLAEAVAAGARLVKPAETVFWGGYSGYFADPDGNLWEVAHNPLMPLDDERRFLLPD